VVQDICRMRQPRRSSGDSYTDHPNIRRSASPASSSVSKSALNSLISAPQPTDETKATDRISCFNQHPERIRTRVLYF
jgi:hypothetical protein